MGTKTTKTKSATLTKRAAGSKPASEKVAEKPTNRALPKAVARTAKAGVRQAKKPPYSQEDVALRAYFIAERRQAAALPGDSHQDWIEAERQLAAEASTIGRRKPSKS